MWINLKPVNWTTVCFCREAKLVRVTDIQKPASTTLLNDRRINFSFGLWLRCHPSHCEKSNQRLAQVGSRLKLASSDRRSFTSCELKKECYVLRWQLMKRQADAYLQRQAQTRARQGLMLNQHYRTCISSLNRTGMLQMWLENEHIPYASAIRDKLIVICTTPFRWIKNILALQCTWVVKLPFILIWNEDFAFRIVQMVLTELTSSTLYCNC